MTDRFVDPTILTAMRRDWDARAKQNARHYVATSKQFWLDEDFYRSGAAEVHDLVERDLERICKQRDPAEMKVLEIGCGAGRMTLSLSHLFGEVSAVDISSEMIAQAGSALRERPNVKLYVNNGADLSLFADNSFDFALSAIVFQHIPKRVIVENYIRETWRVLKPNSLFKFQVQGCPIQEKEANTWVGVGFSETDMVELASRHRFVIMDLRGAGTQYFWLTFLKE